MYLHLLRLYLSTPENQPIVSFAEENNQNAFETNLAAAFRLLGEQANRIDTVQVSRLSFARTGNVPMLSAHDHVYHSYSLSDFAVFRIFPFLQPICL